VQNSVERQYWLQQGEETVGPFQIQYIHDLIRQGIVPPNALVYPVDGTEWMPAQEIEAPVEARQTPPKLPSVTRPASISNIKLLMYVGQALAGLFLLYLAFWVVYGRIQVSMANASTQVAVQEANSQAQKVELDLKAQQDAFQQQNQVNQQKVHDFEQQRLEKIKGRNDEWLSKQLDELDSVEQEKRELVAKRNDLLEEYGIDPSEVEDK
jgi:GYF domain 2